MCREVLARVPSVSDQQRGYALIELMIALLLGLFLLGGLVTLVGGTRQSSSNQNSLAQLQDEQRLAMSMLNDVIQTAGYFDATAYFSATEAFITPVSTSGTGSNATLTAGQILGGTHTSLTTPDSIVVRYATSGTDQVLNCNGGSSAVATTYTNFFFVNTTTTPNQLQCSIDGNAADAVTLVPNVVNLQAWYGVSTAIPTTTGVANADTYVTADQVTNWAAVVSVRVTVTFINPLANQPGQSAYSYFTRLIPLQARTGSNFTST